jgi:hypothetical protein
MPTPARLQPYRAVTVKTLAGPKATTVSESDARFAEIMKDLDEGFERTRAWAEGRLEDLPGGGR